MAARDDEAGSGSAVGPEAGGRPEDEPGSGVMVAFGRQLKLLRLRAGLDRTEFGNRVGYAAQSVASFEQGRRIPQPGFIDQADPVLDAGGLLLALKEEVARAQYPAFFRDAARLEAVAASLHVYAALAVPGLLQTEEYARAVFTMRRPLLDDETVEQRVAARMARQKIFERKPMPTLSFVIEESALRRPIGGWPVLRGQLEQIVLHARRRNVELQVMPTDRAEHCGLAGPFNLIEKHDGRRMAYVEVQRDSRLHTELTVVRDFYEQYGLLRAQALAPPESLAFVEGLLGEKR
ncbi:helix-turn-helix domain-containing protein [Streptomyces durocortorensis]|uniref:Helix-turn-helix transcriptional regulator n=1 Tax=Streptomyces durocortorensis TaxID=2811104 RepID=A0ABS2HXF8_9ACTN|nr:helix-turn-helix transcriptional regulator [Streptomyces durocortorensis]MBM7055405.1 helix-turn-helix transcriptional regulator [Streptomyces durocortorensis]